MKIKINGAEHTCESVRRGLHQGWIIQSVSPKPAAIDGVVEVFHDEGVSADILRYTRAVIVGDTIWLSNLPPYHPMAPECSMTYKLAVIRENADKQVQQITDAIMRGLNL